MKTDRCDFCMDEAITYDEVSGLHCCEEHFKEIVEERD